jgi:hypothetical protein
MFKLYKIEEINGKIETFFYLFYIFIYSITQHEKMFAPQIPPQRFTTPVRPTRSTFTFPPPIVRVTRKRASYDENVLDPVKRRLTYM